MKHKISSMLDYAAFAAALGFMTMDIRLCTSAKVLAGRFLTWLLLAWWCAHDIATDSANYEPPPPPKAPSGYHLRPFWRKHRWLLQVAGLLVLVVSPLLILAWMVMAAWDDRGSIKQLYRDAWLMTSGWPAGE